MLYSQGLRPFYKSNKNKQTDYQQIPNDVKFLENTEQDYFSLKFSYYFGEDNEAVEFCSQPPFSYTMML